MTTFVVAGATGRVGSVVANELRRRGHEVTALVRDTSRVTDLLAQGARIARGSLDDPAFLLGALRDATAFFALLPEDPVAPDFHEPRQRMTATMAAAVKESGVSRVVLLSATAASLAEGNGPARDLHELEAALATTGTSLATLRACWFQENIGAVLSPATNASIYPSFLPSADVAFPTIATRDVGQIAATELLSGPASAETIDLLGPAYSVRRMSHVLGRALGKTLRVVDFPAAAHVSVLMQAGLSESFAKAVAELYACTASGRIRPQGDRSITGTTTLEETVERLVGRTT